MPGIENIINALTVFLPEIFFFGPQNERDNLPVAKSEDSGKFLLRDRIVIVLSKSIFVFKKKIESRIAIRRHVHVSFSSFRCVMMCRI